MADTEQEHIVRKADSAFAEYRRPLPKCEEFQTTHLCIPVGWWVSDVDRERVAECVIKFAR